MISHRDFFIIEAGCDLNEVETGTLVSANHSHACLRSIQEIPII